MAAEQKDLLFLVEDDQAWIATLKAKLKNSFRLEVFTTGEEAVAQLHQKPRLLLLDYGLEGAMNGLDVLKEVKKQLPESICIMLSGQDNIQLAIDILNSGAYDYIVKSDTSLKRLDIILRNIEKRDQLQHEVLELRLRFRRERLAFFALIILILISSALILLQTCPSQRSISWDPLNRANDPDCIELKQ